MTKRLSKFSAPIIALVFLIAVFYYDKTSNSPDYPKNNNIHNTQKNQNDTTKRPETGEINFNDSHNPLH